MGLKREPEGWRRKTRRRVWEERKINEDGRGREETESGRAEGEALDHLKPGEEVLLSHTEEQM